MPLIAPDQHLALMGALFAIAGLGFLAERTRVGAHFTGAVIALRRKPGFAQSVSYLPILCRY